MGLFWGTLRKKQMAASTSNDSSELTLQETDIPGAALSKTVEQCTNAVLKRRLSCRGARATREFKQSRRRALVRLFRSKKNGASTYEWREISTTLSKPGMAAFRNSPSDGSSPEFF